MFEDKDDDMYTQEYAEQGLDNSYMVLTGKITLEELFVKYPYRVYLAHVPGNVENESAIIDDLILHYTYYEEYEKCVELQKLKMFL